MGNHFFPQEYIADLEVTLWRHTAPIFHPWRLDLFTQCKYDTIDTWMWMMPQCSCDQVAPSHALTIYKLCPYWFNIWLWQLCCTWYEPIHWHSSLRDQNMVLSLQYLWILARTGLHLTNSCLILIRDWLFESISSSQCLNNIFSKLIIILWRCCILLTLKNISMHSAEVIRPFTL